MTDAKPINAGEPCKFCGGTAGRLLNGAHCLCTARAAAGVATPSLGDRCQTCNGSGATGKGGVFLDLTLGPAMIARSLTAQFPPCKQCSGTGVINAKESA